MCRVRPELRIHGHAISRQASCSVRGIHVPASLASPKCYTAALCSTVVMSLSATSMACARGVAAANTTLGLSPSKHEG
jgi:hypothetical protein